MSLIRLLLVCILSGIAASATGADVPVSTSQITLSFAPVVKRVVPAVVNIYTRHVEKVATSPFLNDPLFSQFFGEQGYGGLPRERIVNSLGSGVIVEAAGTIVTSYHVVKGSDEITVVLADKREFKGHVEKIDERSDLAVLKVDTKGARLPTLELRDSDTLEVGDLVLAVGNPFGVGQTVTSGIISALARSEAAVSDYQFFIQTDAAINPGNSGGALVDMQGRLIGINTAIYSRSGGYQGIGFAIPSDMVRAVLKGQATKTGSLIRPWFGVEVQAVTREVADAQGLDVPKGVLVKEVKSQSPADKAGIKPGDIITALGSGDVNDSQSLNFRIATAGIGTVANVTLWRQGKEQILPVTLIASPIDNSLKAIILKGKHPLSGVSVATLTPEMAEEMHLKTARSRVIVLRGSQEQGILGASLEQGDIIAAINGTQVSSVQELEKILSVHTRQFQITIARGHNVFTMAVVQ